MAGKQLKDLAVAYRRRDDTLFHNTFTQIIAEEEAKKHTALARELSRLVGSAPRSTAVPPIPVNRDNSLPLAVFRPLRHTFDNLILDPGVRAQLDRIITEVQFGEQLDAAGIPRRNRTLLYGPPGCGKTSVVEALGSTLGRPVFIARPDGLVSSYLGKTAGNLAELFKFIDTGEYILLLDEFDTLGQSRDEKDNQGEMRRVVNAVLQLTDNYQGPSLIVAATNRSEILDAALWRRFDTVVELQLPTQEQILGLVDRLLPEGHTVTATALKAAASRLDGLPHAAAEYFAHSAIRNAMFAGRPTVQPEDVPAALEETVSRRWA